LGIVLFLLRLLRCFSFLPICLAFLVVFMNLLLHFIRVREVASGNAGSLSQCFVDAILNKDCQFDSDAFRIFDDLPVTEYSINLGS
jgi:hypothetical protein